MTYEQLFSGRMRLMSAQRHIAQAEISYSGSSDRYQFKSSDGENAFFLVERLLVDLENEFTAKKTRCTRQKRQRLDRRADRQVSR